MNDVTLPVVALCKVDVPDLFNPNPISELEQACCHVAIAPPSHVLDVTSKASKMQIVSVELHAARSWTSRVRDTKLDTALHVYQAATHFCKQLLTDLVLMRCAGSSHSTMVAQESYKRTTPRCVVSIDPAKHPWEQEKKLHNRWHPDIPHVGLPNCLSYTAVSAQQTMLG